MPFDLKDAEAIFGVVAIKNVSTCYHSTSRAVQEFHDEDLTILQRRRPCEEESGKRYQGVPYL